MPATYAHFRFGREVLRRLSPETREAITPRIQLYHIGLHGPDIFFYYHPLSKNPVQALGGQLVQAVFPAGDGPDLVDVVVLGGDLAGVLPA